MLVQRVDVTRWHATTDQSDDGGRKIRGCMAQRCFGILDSADGVAH